MRDSALEKLLPARMPITIIRKRLKAHAGPLPHAAPRDQQPMIAEQRLARSKVITTPATTRSVDLLQLEGGGWEECKLA